MFLITYHRRQNQIDIFFFCLSRFRISLAPLPFILLPTPLIINTYMIFSNGSIASKYFSNSKCYYRQRAENGKYKWSDTVFIQCNNVCPCSVSKTNQMVYYNYTYFIILIMSKMKNSQIWYEWRCMLKQGRQIPD